MNKIILLNPAQLIIFFLFVFVSCSEENVNEVPAPYTYQVPIETDDGWETADISEVGIDKEKLVKLIDYINIKMFKNIHCVMIVKNDKLVFEEYFRGHTFQ